MDMEIEIESLKLKCFCDKNDKIKVHRMNNKKYVSKFNDAIVELVDSTWENENEDQANRLLVRIFYTINSI